MKHLIISISLLASLTLPAFSCGNAPKGSDGNATEKNMEGTITEEKVEAPQEKKQVKTDWMDGDFTIEYDLNIMGMYGLSRPQRLKQIKCGNTIYTTSSSKGKTKAVWIVFEDNKLVQYRIDPATKKAERSVIRHGDLRSVLRKSLEMLRLKRDALELAEKTGREKIAGRDCDVYVQKNSLMDEENTIWLDEELGLVLRRHTRIKPKDKKPTEADMILVKSVSLDKVNPKEVEVDLSGYTIIQK